MIEITESADKTGPFLTRPQGVYLGAPRLKWASHLAWKIILRFLNPTNWCNRSKIGDIRTRACPIGIAKIAKMTHNRG
jgi:hypothetical protein